MAEEPKNRETRTSGGSHHATRLKRRRRRRIIAGVILVLLALGIGGYLLVRGRIASVREEAQEVSRRTFEVRLISDRQTVEVSGNVEPARSHNHSFPMTRRLVALNVRPGDPVSEGQLIAVVDDTQERYNLANLELTIEEAELEGSARRLEVLELQRELLSAELDATRLRAQFSGTVVDVGAMVGERVSPNTVIARVIDTSSLTAEVEINEYDLPLISEGLAIELRFDAIPGEVFTGELSRISPEGTVNAQGLAVVAAEILIEDPDPRIVPSYSFLAEILLSGEDAVLAVEEEAVIERQGRTIAFLAPGEGERAVPRVVQTEALGGGLVRVVSGLEEGDVVLDAAGLLDVIGENGGPGPFRRPPLGRRIFGGGGAGARRGAGGGDAGFDGPPAEGRRPGGGLGPGSGADQNGVGR